MELSFIDLHSDTASTLCYRKKSLAQNDLHVSLDKASVYRNYAQVFAVYTWSKLSDEEGYQAFLKVSDFFFEELKRCESRIGFAADGKILSSLWKEGRSAAFLAVEDARLLAGDPERILALYDRGVRFLTLTWADETCIGGSWNTTAGLTDFGKQTVRDCFRLGIVPDVSHASVSTIDDVIEIAKEYEKPFVATHSNAYAIYPHGRNLIDRHFEAIRDSRGLVGMNMYKEHLTDNSVTPATTETIFAHIEHFMELGGENTVCFGCDFDGADFPDALQDVSSIAQIADTLLAHNYSEALVRKIFWENALDFFLRMFPADKDGRIFT